MSIEHDELSEIVRMGDSSNSPPPRSPMVWLLVLVAALPIGLGVWAVLYEGFFEGASPEIEVIESPTGIGENPAILKLRLKDDGAGLSAVAISLQQKKNPSRTIFKKEYSGEKVVEESITIGGPNSGIERGTVRVEVRLFDRGFWSSAAVKSFDWKVSFTRPKAAVVTSMHNAHLGGSQLAFYRTTGSDLASSGIRVGSNYFAGVPARVLDPELKDPNLWAVFYALDAREKEQKPEVKVFAKDSVENLFLGNFYNLVIPRKFRSIRTNIRSKDEFPPVLDNFSSATKTVRSEFIATLPIIQPRGVVFLAFGDDVDFQLDGKTSVGHAFIDGYGFRFGASEREAVALTDGYVHAVGKSRKGGVTVILDHGMGFTTLYDRLEQTTLKKGDKIAKGAVIGIPSLRKDGVGRELYIEGRIQGVPVDLREWWDERWCKDHITKKIQEIKKQAISGYLTQENPETEEQGVK